MGGQRSWLRGVALIGFVGLAWAPGTWAQSQTGASSLSGIGFMPQGVMGGSTQGGLGVVAVPSVMGVGTQPGTGVGSANAMMMDPLGLNYVYGPAIPMTRAQAGLFMLSTQQRMLGLGNGQISGGPSCGSRSHRSKDGQLVRNEPDCGPHKERKHSGWPGRSLFQSGDNDGIRFPGSFQAAVALFPSDDTITRIRGFSI